MKGIRHNSNSRPGKQPPTATDPGHNHKAGHARALRKLGHRASRRRINRWYKEGAEIWEPERK